MMDDWEIVQPSAEISDRNNVKKTQPKAEILKCKHKDLVGDFCLDPPEYPASIHSNCTCVPDCCNSGCPCMRDGEISSAAYANFGTDNTAKGKLSYLCLGDNCGCHSDFDGGCGCFNSLCEQGRHGNRGLLFGRNETSVPQMYHGSGLSEHDRDPNYETSRLVSKLRIASSELKELVSSGYHTTQNSTILKYHDTVLSLAPLLKKAADRIEQLGDSWDELYCVRHLLRLQKTRNKKLQEDIIRLNISLQEVNEDYGRLLVECESRERIFETKQSSSRSSIALERKLDKFTQTPSLIKVDVGTDILLSHKSLAAQTELQDSQEGGQASQVAGSSVGEVRQTGNCRSQIESRNVVPSAQGVENSPESNTTNLIERDTKPVTRNCTEVHHEPAANVSLGRSESAAKSGNNVNQTASSARGQTTDHQGVSDSPGISRSSSDPQGSTDANRATVPSIPWPCSHYKRRCMVKFACCEEYYPCHRCHNKEKKCSKEELKSKDAILLKCLACNESQRFTESSQTCRKCGIKFGDYFCHPCQHLTGTDDHPYHCDKCGICRVHGNRSFHCDVCNVCLDIQLRDNHVCREGSAHDPCGICFKDAFYGCHLLPCSHKVHKECAKLMIENGVRCCPICRQSFAHRLQRV